jgi:hypothetical protein
MLIEIGELADQFLTLYNKDSDGWWKIFSPDVQDMLKETRSLISYKFVVSDFAGKIKLMDQWVNVHKDDEYPYPVYSAEDPYQITLNKFIERLKAEYPDSWWNYFSIETRKTWEEKNISKPVQTRRTESESITMIEKYARIAHEKGERTMPRTGQAAKTDEERRLGEFLRSTRKKYGDKWLEKFSNDVVQMWRDQKLLRDFE